MDQGKFILFSSSVPGESRKSMINIHDQYSKEVNHSSFVYE